MKKVAVLTMTGALNYGAILQAIALKKVLLDNNIQPYFVNYQTRRQKSQYSVINIYNPCIKTFKKNLLNILNIKKTKRKIAKFKACIENDLLSSNTVLKTQNEVINYLRNFDTVIVGSDQVWNLTLNDSSEVYFLDFSKHEKRIAYAVSLGGNLESIYHYKDYILSKVKDFDYISVREDIALDFFNKNKINVKQTLDPTLLVEPSWWEKIAIQPPILELEYIVYYSVNCKPYSVQICEKISNYLELPVYNLYLHPGIARANFKPFYDIGPYEFLGIIKHATLVCTDSYHGLIFSILFKKNFVVPTEGNQKNIICEDRKLTLLKKFDLTNHLFTRYTYPDYVKDLKNIDNNIFKKIDDLKKQSINFILESLE